MTDTIADHTAAPIFLTGGTGFLGSFLGAEFLRRGREVTFLVRPSGRQSAAERMDAMLNWHGIEPTQRRRTGRALVRVVAGDITEPGLGLDAAARAQVAGTPHEIVHCASNTSFVERKREEITAVNVGGLRHLLDFAAATQCTAFHHVSTAYVAGRRQGRCPEVLSNGQGFHNPYEATKAQGERMVLGRCRAAGIPCTVYRPTIVYGHTETGRTLRFDALYYPVRTALFLKRVYERDIREHGGKKAAKMGIHLAADGTLHLPVRVKVAAGGGLNLIPIDYFVAAFFAIVEEGRGTSNGGALNGGALSGGNLNRGRIFHIANDRLTRIEDLITYTERRFGVSGLRACTVDAYEREAPNALETLVERYLAAYEPYMCDTRHFALDHSRPILAQRGLTCPNLDYDLFSRCMAYGVEVDWKPDVGRT